MTVTVFTDSVASIAPDVAAAQHVEVVSLRIYDGEQERLDAAIEPEAFYRRLPELFDHLSSSQPSLEAFRSAFERAADRGSDVLGVFISEAMSGTLSAARLAIEEISERFPRVRFDVVDSRSNSMQEGFVALAAASAAQAGQTIEACAQAARDTIGRTRYLFTPESLEYLRRGGRIGTASALVGSLLSIRPVLTVSNGVTTPVAKVRGAAKAWGEIARRMADDVSRCGLVDAVVHYIGDRGPAERFATETIAPVVGHDVRILPVSPVVGMHVGPAVGVVYLTERPLDES